MQERWGLRAYQKISPWLEEKLAFTATLAGTYAEAAALAKNWGSPVEDSTVHTLVQRVGQKAEEKSKHGCRALRRN